MVEAHPFLFAELVQLLYLNATSKYVALIKCVVNKARESTWELS